MWTSQVYGHHDKMARPKTHRTSQNTEDTKTQQTLRNNFRLGRLNNTTKLDTEGH